MDNDELMSGLEDALRLLMDHVPAVEAWTAIRAVTEVLIWAKEVTGDVQP